MESYILEFVVKVKDEEEGELRVGTVGNILGSEERGRGSNARYEIGNFLKDNVSRAMLHEFFAFDPCRRGNGGHVAMEGLTCWLAQVYA